jgi:isoleucyl-tRNA synthetase
MAKGNNDNLKAKWKDSLNLPKTQFPMKAQLNIREPQILKHWEETDIYKRIMDIRSDAPKYILHDGPPYANGNIHLGHALNKILKDFIVKTKSMEGFQAPYVPGWDCHGLPIEHKVDQNLGDKKKDMPVLKIRYKCRDYAEKFLNIQREEFKRLGVFGDWNNPYKTIDPRYEASIIEFFKSFVKKGNVYRKKRPVYWCASCQTALAEAEVEYADHVSPSIYVKFLLKDKPELLKEYKDKEIFVLIWTTTPWTIPANMAIAVHPEFDYSLFELNGELYIAATQLVPAIAELAKGEARKITEFKGSDLEGLNAEHPLYDRNSLIINTDYVVLDQGTGCVHTAPGHGEEDYVAGLAHNLDIYSPVGPGGLFDESSGQYHGQHVFKANPVITEDLKERNRLLYSAPYNHSYPHCWRCKKPIIYRATEQWFISMDAGKLRENARAAIKEVNWLPPWGEERISNMVENRPDWCISRQRDWGVPIPVFYCESCGEPLLNEETVDKVQETFKNHGSDSWYKLEAAELVPEGSTCGSCGKDKFIKGRDILDVWFESGSSYGLLEKIERHQFPADMYIEGGDQYRGWFQSSLLVGISARETSPYKTCITHGWALDHEGRAMSKSMGNVIKPQTIIEQKGAEVLRLWIAMVNYREDIRLGNEILSRVTESYRKLRNTWRFMLGVLADFDPTKHMAVDDDLREVDRYILYKLQQIKQKVFKSYKEYDYHIIFHTFSNFFINDLSSFYLNFTKDNLYCNGTDSTARRAAQTTIYKLLTETLLLMAPILSFTTEEAWEHVPAFEGKLDSIHLHTFPKVEDKYLSMIDEKSWEALLSIRETILKEIEEARNNKVIGDSLEAHVKLELNDTLFPVIEANCDLLKEILVVSAIDVAKNESERIVIEKTTGNKCPRCWNWFLEDTSGNEHPELCPRCSEVAMELDIDNNE